MPLRIPYDFWEEIEQGPWNSADARNVNICNPALRYTVHWLANTFFARRDACKVKANELSLIYRAVRETLALREVCYREPDNSCIFLAILVRGRKRLLKTKGNVLNFGGMLTPVFMYVGIELDGFTKVDQYRTMDLNYVPSAKFCPSSAWEGPEYIHDFMIRRRRFSSRLPLPAIVDVTTADGICFIPPSPLCLDSHKDPNDVARKRRKNRLTTPYHGRNLEDESDEDIEEEVELEDPEEQPEIPPLSPKASAKHKKRYQLQ